MTLLRVLRSASGVRRHWAALVLAGALAALLAACGSSSSSSSAGATSASSATSSSTPATQTQPASGSTPSNPVTNYGQYVGGSGAAKPGLSPVTIGFINQQGGPPSASFPEATIAAQATVKLINETLGGVHGHPVQLATCFIASAEAQGLTCGQQMAANKGIKAITYGLVSVGNPSIYSVLKGSIPVVLGVSANPADDTAKNVFELEGSSASATGAFGTYIKQAYPQAKTIAIAYQNQPGTVAIVDGEKAAFQAVGLSVKLLPYSTTATDLIGPATEMEQADVTSPACGFVDCPLIAKSIAQINGTKPAISTPLWTYLPPPAYPGGDLPKWIVGEAASNLAYPADPAVKTYLTDSAKYGLPAKDQLSVFASFAWTNLLVIDKVMNEIPFSQLTPAAVAAKLKQFTGTIPLGPPNIDCSGTLVPSAPAVCNNEAQFFQYQGHGQWKQVAGWLKPPGA